VARTQSAPPSRRARRARARLEQPVPRSGVARRPAFGRRPAWQSPIALVSAAAIVVAVVLVLLASRPPSPSPNALTLSPTAYASDLTDGQVLGSKTAPVVIELFADFQCPACKQFVTLELPRLYVDLVTTGTLRIEARDIDILGAGNPDESLELAAGAFCAAEQDRYWQFHDLVFWNQGRENRGDHNATFLASVADQAGVSRSAWDACLRRTDIRKPILDRTAAAAAQGISSTPTLRINGQDFVGVPDYDKLVSMIRQLASAPRQSPAVSSGPAPSGSLLRSPTP
jgi:protein-disulfide isomerase